MGSTTYRILICGSFPKNPWKRAWVETTVNSLLDKFKIEVSELFVFSDLEPGLKLDIADISQKKQIKVVGCIAYEGFINPCSPDIQYKYRQVVSNLYSFKVNGKKGDYESFRKRDLYLINQCNTVIFVWDGIEKRSEYFFNTFKKYAEKGITVYHLNSTSLQSTVFSL